METGNHLLLFLGRSVGVTGNMAVRRWTFKDEPMEREEKKAFGAK